MQKIKRGEVTKYAFDNRDGPVLRVQAGVAVEMTVFGYAADSVLLAATRAQIFQEVNELIVLLQ